MTKPFSLEEVVARIRAILRRTQQQVEDDPIIRVGDLETTRTCTTCPEPDSQST